MTWPVHIAGFGKFLPKERVHHHTIEKELGVKPNSVKEQSGVIYRHRARFSLGETTVGMATMAAKAALKNASLFPEDLDLILHCSAIPEQALPDTASLIQGELGIGNSGIQCQSVHMSCLGFLAALELAGLYIASGKKSCILIVCAEVSSVGLNPNDAKTYGLFGDGAAAVVVVPTPDSHQSCIITSHFETYAQHAKAAEIKGGGTRRHPNTTHCQPEDNYFSMNGPLLLRGSIRHSKSVLNPFEPFLDDGWSNLQLIIPHQPSKVGLKAMQKVLPKDKMVNTLDLLGNCISASIPLTLIHAIENDRLKRGDRVLLIGTGAGLSLGGILLQW